MDSKKTPKILAQFSVAIAQHHNTLTNFGTKHK